jgi:MSHA pilin protein MshC
LTRQQGFTMTELITVMVIIGILSAVAIPRLVGNTDIASLTFRTNVLSAFRYAQKLSVSHRRLVCATVSQGNVTLRMAPANPAVIDLDPTVTCNILLASPDGSSYASPDSAVIAGGTLLGTLYFQPAGRITTDAAGVNLVVSPNNIITITSADSIRLEGATGYVK